MGCDCDAKKVDIVMRVLQGVAIILLIGNIAFVGYCMHQNKVQKKVKSYVYSNLIPRQASKFGGKVILNVIHYSGKTAEGQSR